MAKKRWLYHESFELIDIGDQQIPLKLIKESRQNVRTSVGKDAVYLRIPFWTNQKQQQKLRAWCIKWLKNKHQKTGVLRSLRKKLIHEGYQVQTPNHAFIVRKKYLVRKSGKGTINEGEINLILPQDLSLEEEQNLCRKLINHLLSKRFHKDFDKRVREINHRFFNQPIQSVKLRYNYSKWGSCSTNRNISLSTRLIFVPQEVSDYVIVHELAHLLEMNHSEKFWNLVATIIPEHPKHEKWLRENSWNCDY